MIVPQKYFFIILFFIGSMSMVQAEVVSTAPVPKWVVDRDIDMATVLIDEVDRGGFQVLLSDTQIFYDNKQPHAYTHMTVRLHSLQAIEQMGTLAIAYTPAYQSYRVHHLIIWRDGKAIDMLKSAKATFNSYDVEPNSPEHEGGKTVQLYLPDVRRGDVVDFSYTISGQNTAFGNRAFGWNYVAVNSRVHNVYVRYTLPEKRPLNISYRNGYKVPKITKNKKEITYEWQWDVIEKTELETGIPAWYVQIPTMVYSDFQNWTEVKDWAYDLFSVTGKKNRKISALAKELVKDAKNAENKLKKILGFMQSEVRYVGMEIGRNGFRPFKPQEVLDRRYGDCKDQAVLLTSMLKSVDIKAWPALVNSNGGKVMANFGVSPGAFDHVIVKVDIKGKIYWVDPTRALMTDREASLTPPRMEKALVLQKGPGGLSDIPLQERDEKSPHITVSDHFTFSGDLFDEVLWVRRNKYSGEDVDGMRSAINNVGLRQMGINLRNFRKKKFEGIENNEFTTVEDEGDFLTVVEDYKISKPGTYDQQFDRMEFEYRPRNISENLTRPRTLKDRKSPYGLTYPLRRKSVLEIEIDDVYFQPFEKKISSPYHIFHQKGQYNGNVFEITYSYETLQDHVPVEDLEKFSEEIDLIYDEIFFRLTSPGKEGPAMVSVYQAVKESDQAVSQEAIDDLRYALDDLMRGEPMAGEYGRQEITEILKMEAVTPPFKKSILTAIGQYFSQVQEDAEALYYFDMLEAEYKRVGYRFLIDKAGLYERMENFHEAATYVKRAIKLKAVDPQSKYAQKWHDRLRGIYWQAKDFEKLASELKFMVANYPKVEKYYRELGVVYDMLGQKSKAHDMRKQMVALGFQDSASVPRDDREGHVRSLRPVFKMAPFYPYPAQLKNISGYVIVEFTVTRKGTTKGCKVIEATPEDYFEEAACKAARSFFYYLPGPQEADVDVANVQHKVTFEMEK